MADRTSTKVVDRINDSPEEIERSIERTRSHMDESLAMLGRKLSPSRLKVLRAPLAALSLGLIGLAVFRAYRKGWHVHSRSKHASLREKPTIKRMQVRSMSRFAQLRTILLLASVASKGKPAVFIVNPGKS
jgi:hypothetical protein